jgi:hypothetical protein
MPWSRLAIGICGLVVGSYCAYASFRNGQSLATGADGIAFGSAFAAVVVGSWFLLPLASRETGLKAMLTKAGWLLCVAFVLANAIGYTATHRTDKVGGNSVAITGYDQALAALNIARSELETMKANPRWASTSGCTNATAEKSLGFCQQVTAKQAEVTAAQATISKGRPGAADAQADTIAWVIRADASVVSRALPIFLAVVLDIAASLFIAKAVTPATVVSIDPEPLTPVREPVQITAAKAVRAVRVRLPKKTEPLALPHMVPIKVDGRTKMGRAMRGKAKVANAN